MSMKKYTGKVIFGGIAIGKIRIEGKCKQIVKRNHVDDVEEEVIRYHNAVKNAVEQLKNIHRKAVQDVGEVNAQIFEVHAMMLEDGDYMESVENIIRTQSMNAEYAVAATGDNFVKLFSEMEDEYFRARADDIKDISDRLIKVLSGEEETKEHEDKNEAVILAAEDLTPSETIQMDKDLLLGFVTKYGSVNSHTAILARTMNIPALTGIEINQSWNGKLAIVDGFHGELILEPDEATLSDYQAKKENISEEAKENRKLMGMENVTKSGKKVKIYANIANVSDTYAVLQNDAEGIGLFRSEFLYMESDTFPDEEKPAMA